MRLFPKTFFFLLLISFTGGFLSPQSALFAQKRGQDRQKASQEEQENYFKKWLDEDVLYIITPEEKSVFKTLTTPEEREQFIEQFWFRRDTDPTTAANEFKEEHYRRIAYANERFTSGLPGWMTDRGRIYIIHGPPAEIESHPSGGNYQRPFSEGGGSTSTYPFETWRYRYVEGLGSDIILEFVDPSLSGEYRLALRPEEKDALLFVPGAGSTLAESLGLASKSDRPFFSPGNQNYPLQGQSYRDTPFARYETYSMIQRPTNPKYDDLKRIVEVDISYDKLAFNVRKDYFRLNDQRALVPVTIELENQNLTFVPENGKQVAKVAVYGLVTSITNRVVSEFEDDLVTSLPIETFQQGLSGRSLYQKTLLLESKGRYKLDLVVKDLNSGNVGVVKQALVPPPAKEEVLTASSLILSSFVRRLSEVPKEDQMFVLGDVWIRPSLSNAFSSSEAVSFYVQLYNTAIDQTTLSPSVDVSYKVMDQDNKTVLEGRDEKGESVQFFSGQRVVLIGQLALQNLTPGQYRLEVEVRDRIKDQAVTVRDRFQVTDNTKASISQ